MNSAQHTYKFAKRIIVTVVGLAVLLIGLILIVIPGPAIVVIPLGLGILSIEYAWARNWLKMIRAKISSKNAARHAERSERRRSYYSSE